MSATAAPPPPVQQSPPRGTATQPVPPTPARAGADRESEWVRLACFAALAAWGAGHWAGLIEGSDAGRMTGIIAVATAAAAVLIVLGRSSLGAPLRHAAAAAIGAVTVTVGLVIAGLPGGLLKPARWDELGDGLDRGLSGIHTVEWPYTGDDEWVRLVVLFGAPLLVGLAATVAFWPARRGLFALRTAGLVLLLVLYGVAATEQDPGEPLLRGFLLLALVAAWLWLPRLSTREAASGAAVVLAVGIVALPVAGRLDSDRPWWDYKEWNWFGGGKLVTFDWTHSYGPLDWPREGTTLLNIKADRRHYWKTETLDRFDGFRWLRSQSNDLTPATSELPDRLDPRWDERIEVTVRALRSDLIVGAGTTYLVIGQEGVTTTGDGTSRLLDEPLERGDSYVVRAYAPNPSAAEMRRAGFDYDLDAYPYTEIYLPNAGESALEGSGADPEASRAPTISREAVRVPLPGRPLSGMADAEERLLDSDYAQVYRLARRVTEGSPTVYDTVKRVERHLQETYTYSEQVPSRRFPLAAFLFDERSGYCQQFSGAMALMLRMVGIPARVSTGFSPGSLNQDTGEWRVRDLDAHSWVEVNFPEIGWVPFDPTPSAAPAESQSGGAEATSAARGDALEALGQTAGQGGDPAPSPQADGDEGGAQLEVWMVPLALAAVALGWAAILVGADRRRRGRLAPGERTDVQLRELERALRRLGWPLPAGTTLLGLEGRLARAAGPASARYVAGIRAHRYAPSTPAGPGREQRAALRRELSSGRGPLGRLRGYLAIPPFLGPV